MTPHTNHQCDPNPVTTKPAEPAHGDRVLIEAEAIATTMGMRVRTIPTAAKGYHGGTYAVAYLDLPQVRWQPMPEPGATVGDLAAVLHSVLDARDEALRAVLNAKRDVEQKRVNLAQENARLRRELAEATDLIRSFLDRLGITTLPYPAALDEVIANYTRAIQERDEAIHEIGTYANQRRRAAEAIDALAEEVKAVSAIVHAGEQVPR